MQNNQVLSHEKICFFSRPIRRGIPHAATQGRVAAWTLSHVAGPPKILAINPTSLPSGESLPRFHRPLVTLVVHDDLPSEDLVYIRRVDQHQRNTNKGDDQHDHERAIGG